MTLILVKCERCGKELEVAKSAMVWHLACSERKRGERAPTYWVVEK